MRQKNEVDPGEVMQIHRWVSSTSARNTRAEMDVIAGMKKVRLYSYQYPVYSGLTSGKTYIGQNSDSLPFST